MISFKGFGFMFAGFFKGNFGAGSFAASTVNSASLIYSRSSPFAIDVFFSGFCASCGWVLDASVDGERARFFFDEELNFFSQDGASMSRLNYLCRFWGFCTIQFIVRRAVTKG